MIPGFSVINCDRSGLKQYLRAPPLPEAHIRPCSHEPYESTAVQVTEHRRGASGASGWVAELNPVEGAVKSQLQPLLPSLLEAQPLVARCTDFAAPANNVISHNMAVSGL